MGRIVIVAFRPKTGKSVELQALMRRHHGVLTEEGLATDRQPIIMTAADGTMIEVFEWKSKEAIEAAHGNAAVQALWQEYAEVSDYVPVGEVEEAGALFSEFEAFE